MIKDFDQYSLEEFDRFRYSSTQPFFESLKYSFFSGGKRFRPRLLLSLGQDLGVANRQLYPAALAIELIHTYSLIHDDLPAMDNDEYRRGKLSHHAKYGEASAVLAGDGMLTLAFEVLAENYKEEILKHLILSLSKSAGVAGMIGGQVLDCLSTHRTEDIFSRIHLLKTGMLFGFAVSAPSWVAGLGKVQSRQFEALGHEVGLLFQLQDDLFDEDKKDERAEENILSLISRDDLLKLIEEKKNKVRCLLQDLNLSEDSHFYRLIQFLFERQY